MKVNTLLIGNAEYKNNILLAPMAGYTDYAYRKLQIEMGVGLTFTELVSAKGLVYGAKGTDELLYSKGNEEQTAVQLFGSEPYYMRSACESEKLKKFRIVDINMGCPVPKVYKNGEGSALLEDIFRAEEIVRECVKSGKTITVKIRTGQKPGDDIASEYAKMAENAGAKLITIHGRVRENYYSGEPDYNAIYKAKKSVKIPVIANGGIFTKEDADKMTDRTGADGIMIARGAIANPFLVCFLLNTMPSISLKDYIIRYIETIREIRPDKNTAVELRKFIPYFFKGMNNMKDVKLKIYECDNTKDIIRILNENL